MDTRQLPISTEPPPLPSSALPSPTRHKIVIQGLAWTSLLQGFLLIANFVSMIILVRLLTPAAYGLVAAVNGVTGLVNCFSCGNFIAQAVQLREGEEPDWAAHWNAGLYIQVALFIACNVVAAACWFMAPYRLMAPLLHVASLGFPIDLANLMGLTRLRRDLNYRDLRLVQAACAGVTVVSSISLALLGAGAFALIIGYNVLHGLPLALYLFLVCKWRLPQGWWHWPDWKSYGTQLRFGSQVSGSAGLTAARGILEAAVLPATIGFSALGLLGRAQVLFSTTGGRISSIIVDTVYPLLPRSSGKPQQFSRHATLFVTGPLFVSIPAAAFVAMNGPMLSRLLYGNKWVAADPLIFPSTLFAWAASTTVLLAAVLQAKNRLRLAFSSNLIAALAVLPAMVLAIKDRSSQSYAWTLALGQLAAACIVARLTSGLLENRWIVKGVLPSIIASTAAAVSLTWSNSLLPPLGILPALSIRAVVFSVVLLFIHRLFFPGFLREILLRLPAGAILLRLLLLQAR